MTDYKKKIWALKILKISKCGSDIILLNGCFCS